MAESEQVLVRSYLDALSDYEKVNKEAVAIARHELVRSGAERHLARDEDAHSAAWPESDALRDVMIRWHNSLISVLGAWEQVPSHCRADEEQPS